jgi:hypothetical protein
MFCPCVSIEVTCGGSSSRSGDDLCQLNFFFGSTGALWQSNAAEQSARMD